MHISSLRISYNFIELENHMQHYSQPTEQHPVPHYANRRLLELPICFSFAPETPFDSYWAWLAPAMLCTRNTKIQNKHK